MNYFIENALSRNGIIIDNATQSISTTIMGISHKFSYELDYFMLDRLTVCQASQVNDFFPNRNSVIESEKRNFILNSLESDKTNKDLSLVINLWNAEEILIKRAINELNERLVATFLDFQNKCLMLNDIDRFLDDICVETHTDKIEISSKHSKYKHICFSYDKLSNAVNEYILQLLSLCDITLEDENLNFDDRYWCALEEKFDLSFDEKHRTQFPEKQETLKVPESVIKELAQSLLPDIIEFYNSEKGQEEFKKYLEEKNKKSNNEEK